MTLVAIKYTYLDKSPEHAPEHKYTAGKYRYKHMIPGLDGDSTNAKVVSHTMHLKSL